MHPHYVKVTKKDNQITGEFAGEKLISESLKIQWTTEDFLEMNVNVPHLLFVNNKYNNDSLEKIKGYAEGAAGDIKSGDIVQFERFGFVRVENKDNKLSGFFAHK